MTLVEVLAALLLTTVGLLGTLMMINIVIRGASFSRSVTEASVLAQSQLEAMVSLKTGTVGGALPSNSGPTSVDANGVANANGPYSVTVTWSSPSSSFRVCTVLVTWIDAVGASHSLYAQRQQALQ